MTTDEVDRRIAERWKPVPGYEDRYEVSNRGCIRSLFRFKRPRRMMAQVHRSGHLFVNLRDGSSVKRGQLHRLVLLAFRGDPPEGCVASHLNGDPADNRLENLAWESDMANRRRMVEHGTILKGENHPMAKLTDEQCAEMAALRSRGMTFTELGRRYGVHKWTAAKACRRAIVEVLDD
jgi:hypothetical protein